VKQPINVFEVLLRTEEDGHQEKPHDRMLAWLCNPDSGHGLFDLALAIVSHLWGRDFNEKVKNVSDNKFALGPSCWPDVVVEFDTSILVVENKVKLATLQKAIKECQLEKQHEQGRARPSNGGFFHCLLCPDSMKDLDGIPLRSEERFRVLPYSLLANLIADHSSNLVSEAKPIVEQYVTYLQNTLGKPSAVKWASSDTITDRYRNRKPVDVKEFLNQAMEKGGPELVAAQQNLLESLTGMQHVEPRFESYGVKEKTYTMKSTHSDMPPLLWIYADGRIFVNWASFLKGQRTLEAERMKHIWGPYVKDRTKDAGSETQELIGVLKPELIAELLQRTVEP